MSGNGKNILFYSEEPSSVEEIGEFLIQVGQKLKEQGFFNLSQGEAQTEVRPAGAVKLEVKYAVKKQDKHELEIEIEWKPGMEGRRGEKMSVE